MDFTGYRNSASTVPISIGNSLLRVGADSLELGAEPPDLHPQRADGISQLLDLLVPIGISLDLLGRCGTGSHRGGSEAHLQVALLILAMIAHQDRGRRLRECLLHVVRVGDALSAYLADHVAGMDPRL